MSRYSDGIDRMTLKLGEVVITSPPEASKEEEPQVRS